MNFFDFSYIVPEYSFLDARGLGAYEGKTLESVSEVLFFTSALLLSIIIDIIFISLQLQFHLLLLR